MNRDGGVIQKRKGPLWPAPRTVAAADAFAGAIAARYAANGFTSSGVERALAFEPQPQVNYFQDAPKIDVFPQIAIHEHHSFPATTREMAAAPAASGIFDRLFSRQTRVAAFDPARSQQSPRPGDLMAPILRDVESAPQARGIERVLPRAAGTPADKPAGTSAAGRSASRPALDTGWGTPPAIPQQPAPITLPAPEIRRVADQVMREIDHRIIAQRERMGRR